MPPAVAAAGRVTAALLLTVALLPGCPTTRDHFSCSEPRQCSLTAEEAFCEATSATCSYADFTCECTWRRHGSVSGALSGRCVAAPPRDGGRTGGRPPPVVVSEVAVRGCPGGDATCASPDGTDEYVELHNTTSTPIDLANHMIQHRNLTSGDWKIYSRLNGSTIGAHGFLLIANVGYQDQLDVRLSRSENLDDQHGLVRIFVEPSATIVDVVSWGAGASELAEDGGCSVGWPRRQSSAASVIERKAYPDSTVASMGPGGNHEKAGNEHDTNDSADDFVVREARGPQTSKSQPEMP